MKYLRAWIERVDWLEFAGLVSFAIFVVGLWKLDEAFALTIGGGIGFIVVGLAIRNRRVRKG